jgi:sensor domain CHASE-containing protein
MGGLGVPELVITLVTVVLGLVPFVVAIWAVLTLREVQQSQNAIERRLETIEQLLRQR